MASAPGRALRAPRAPDGRSEKRSGVPAHDSAVDLSLFEAAAKALHWAEVDCQTFGTARRYRDDQVLEIGVGMVPDRWYRVRIGRVRRWIRETALYRL